MMPDGRSPRNAIAAMPEPSFFCTSASLVFEILDVAREKTRFPQSATGQNAIPENRVYVKTCAAEVEKRRLAALPFPPPDPNPVEFFSFPRKENFENSLIISRFFKNENRKIFHENPLQKRFSSFILSPVEGPKQDASPSTCPRRNNNQ